MSSRNDVGLHELSDDRDPVWRCKDGREMRVSEMETRHIINSICMIQRSPIRRGRRWRERYLPALRCELQERMRRAEQEELKREHR